MSHAKNLGSNQGKSTSQWKVLHTYLFLSCLKSLRHGYF